MKNKDLKDIFENTTLKCDPDPSKKAIYDKYGCKILTLLEVLPDDVEINGIDYLEQTQFSSKDDFENFIKSDKDEVERTLDKLADRLTEWTEEWISKHPYTAEGVALNIMNKRTKRCLTGFLVVIGLLALAAVPFALLNFFLGESFCWGRGDDIASLIGILDFAIGAMGFIWERTDDMKKKHPPYTRSRQPIAVDI